MTTEYSWTDSLNKATARKNMQKWLNRNTNLVNTVLKLAKKKGSDLEKVVGSLASHGQFDMIDGDDNLDLISGTDPLLTAVNKIDYVKGGQEPLGVLRAVYEIWSSPDSAERATLLAEIKKRGTAGSRDWNNIIIENAFKLISTTANWKNAFYTKSMQEVVLNIYKYDNKLPILIKQHPLPTKSQLLNIEGDNLYILSNNNNLLIFELKKDSCTKGCLSIFYIEV